MRVRLNFVLALFALVGGSPAATAEPRCYSPSDLAARPGEHQPVRGDRRFDSPLPARELAPAAPLSPALHGSIRRVELPKGLKLVALTFDLCEAIGEVSGYQGDVVDYLRREGVKATFFAGGKWMRSHAERTQQLMTDPLFEIASHAEAHRNLRRLDGPALTDEILGPQRSYEAIREAAAGSAAAPAQCSGPARREPASRIQYFRFPYGACNPQAMQAVNAQSLAAIQWDVSIGDPAPHMSAEAIARNMLRATPGSIIIGHANGRGHNTAAALAIAIPKMKAEGFSFVTVSELLAAGTPVVAPTCYDSRPGDTDRYDVLLPRRKPEVAGWHAFFAPTPKQRRTARTTKHDADNADHQ